MTSENRTAAATAARMRAREIKLARILADRGWTCLPPSRDIPPVGEGMRLYASNGLRETYHVIGWTADRKPILQAGKEGKSFIGLQDDYHYTVGAE